MDNIDKYVNFMQEIRVRTDVIKSIKDKNISTGINRIDIEVIYFQMRKILELIALGSLVLNADKFEKGAEKFSKWYHAERILRSIKELNPQYYPQPIEEIWVEYEGQRVRKAQMIEEGYLTEKDFIKCYDKCNKIVHAENPFGSKIDLIYYEKNISVWLSKIIRLLNRHIIKLLDDDNLYLIHMNSAQDHKVHGYIFENTGIHC
ncbi:MAG: hypothetical protein LUE98_18955 [Tannerellaceae bacterium]|nr:hypothetical protein [Tannerellaceae bacterium]